MTATVHFARDLEARALAYPTTTGTGRMAYAVTLTVASRWDSSSPTERAVLDIACFDAQAAHLVAEGLKTAAAELLRVVREAEEYSAEGCRDCAFCPEARDCQSQDMPAPEGWTVETCPARPAALYEGR